MNNNNKNSKEEHSEALNIADVSGTFICDVCDCEHDMSYKCAKCSNKAYINTHEDVCGYITSEWAYSGDVCGNCCNCH